MSEGLKKPEYVPPTLGDELERHGMKYDFESGVVASQDSKQKKSRKRNKGSRRDSNNHRPTKEVSMSNENIESSNVNGQAGGREITPPSNNNVGQVMTEGFRNLREDLKDFAGKIVVSNADLKSEMPSLLGRATETTIGEVHRKSNEWTLENMKGDVRRALVQVGVAGAVAGIISLGTYLFTREDESFTIEGRAPSQANGTTRTTSTRTQS
jgi:hypothetical protein